MCILPSYIIYESSLKILSEDFAYLSAVVSRLSTIDDDDDVDDDADDNDDDG